MGAFVVDDQTVVLRSSRRPRKSSTTSLRSNDNNMEEDSTDNPSHQEETTRTDSSSCGLLISRVHQLRPTTTMTSVSQPQTLVGLILASQSPRRREILDMMGLQGRFTTIPSPLNETAVQHELKNQPQQAEGAVVDPRTYTERLAQAKAEALAHELQQQLSANNKQQQPEQAHVVPPLLILGSDTIVDLEGVILEKPTSVAEAQETLARLSGRTHLVHTGVALYALLHAKGQDETNPNQVQIQRVSSLVDTTQVTFATLQSTDIQAYVATGEPMDKAGSYGIQGMGGQFVQNIQGDFFTVRNHNHHNKDSGSSLMVLFLALLLSLCVCFYRSWDFPCTQSVEPWPKPLIRSHRPTQHCKVSVSFYCDCVSVGWVYWCRSGPFCS